MPGRPPPPAPGKEADSAAAVVPGAAAAAAALAKYAEGGGDVMLPPGRRGGGACTHRATTNKGAAEQQKSVRGLTVCPLVATQGVRCVESPQRGVLRVFRLTVVPPCCAGCWTTVTTGGGGSKQRANGPNAALHRQWHPRNHQGATFSAPFRASRAGLGGQPAAREKLAESRQVEVETTTLSGGEGIRTDSEGRWPYVSRLLAVPSGVLSPVCSLRSEAIRRRGCTATQLGRCSVQRKKRRERVCQAPKRTKKDNGMERYITIQQW
jgi:hypothetical protein